MGVENASGTGEGVGRFDVKEEVVLKILLVGAPKSGKTSFVRRLCDKPFRKDYMPTLGFDVIVVPHGTYQGRPVALHLWDVAGSQLNAKPCHHSLIGQGAEGVLYVLDVTSRDSLQAVDEWDRALSKYLPPWSCKLLVGHKADLPVYVVNDEALSLYVAGANGFRGWCLTVGNSDYGDYDVAARRGGGGMRDADGRYKGQSLSGEKQLSVSEAVRTLINNLFRAGGARGLGARPSNVLGLGASASGATPLPSANLEAAIEIVEGLGLGGTVPRREGDDRRDKEGLHGAKGDSSMRELLRRGRGPGVDWRRRSAAAEQAHNGRLRESAVDPGWQYFAGRMGREDAEALLRGRPEGTFFLRRKGPSVLVLTYVASSGGGGSGGRSTPRKSMGGASPRSQGTPSQRRRLPIGGAGVDGQNSKIAEPINEHDDNTAVQHALLVYEGGCFGDEKGRLGRFATLEELLGSKISAIARYPLKFRRERGRYVLVEGEEDADPDGAAAGVKNTLSPSGNDQLPFSPTNLFPAVHPLMVAGNPVGAQLASPLVSPQRLTSAAGSPLFGASDLHDESWVRMKDRRPSTHSSGGSVAGGGGSGWGEKRAKGKSAAGASQWMEAAAAVEKYTGASSSSSSKRSSTRRRSRSTGGEADKAPPTRGHRLGRALLDNDGRLVRTRPRRGSVTSTDDGSVSSSATESVDTDGYRDVRQVRRSGAGGVESAMATAAQAAAASAAVAATSAAHPRAKLVLERVFHAEVKIDAATEALELELRPLARPSHTAAAGRRSSRGSSLSSPRGSMSPSARLDEEQRWLFPADSRPAGPRLDAAAVLLIDRAWSSRHGLVASLNALRERAVGLAVAEAVAPPEAARSLSLSSPDRRWASDASEKNRAAYSKLEGFVKKVADVRRTLGVVPPTRDAVAGGEAVDASRVTSGETRTASVVEATRTVGLGLSTCRDFDRILGDDDEVDTESEDDARGSVTPDQIARPIFSDSKYAESRGQWLSRKSDHGGGAVDGLPPEQWPMSPFETSVRDTSGSWRKILAELEVLEKQCAEFLTCWKDTAAIMVDSCTEEDDLFAVDDVGCNVQAVAQ